MDIIAQFEEQYPGLAESLKQIQEDQYTLFAKKMLSYGLGNISVGSNLDTEEDRLISQVGLWYRMNDKIQRLKQLVVLRKDNPLEDEPVDDAYTDLSIYGIIGLLVKTGKWRK